MYKLKHLLIAILTLSIFSACVKDDDFEIPKAICDDGGLSNNKEVQAVLDGSSVAATEYISDTSDDDIIEGYVTSSDQGGNFYKTISFQNTDGTLGFSIPVDQTDLYTVYNPGRKVFIKLNGLYTQIAHDALTIGALYNDNVGRIAAGEYYKHLIPSCEEPMAESDMVKQRTIDQITYADINTLIELSGVQFEEAAIGKTLYDKDNVLGGATNWDIVDSAGNTLIFRTSEYADFADIAVPEGNGTIRGVLTKYYNDYQFMARTISDLDLNGDRKRIGYAENIGGTKISIADLRAKFTGSDTTVPDDAYIEGIVTMSGIDENNMSSKNAYIQDDSGAIALRFSGSNDNKQGYQLKISVKDILLSEYNGLLQANITQNLHVEFVSEGNADPTPVVVTIAELLTGNYESQLVQMDAVQFVNASGTFSGGQNITDCTDEVVVYTTSYANFADDTYPSGNGSIYGIASVYNTAQLLLRSATDTDGMTGDRCQTAGVIVGTGFYISEYAEGSSNNKYIELYNGTSETIDLTNYQLWGSNNGGDWKEARKLALSGSLAPGAVYVIAADAADQAILDKADLAVPYESPVHYNGDDAVGLFKVNGNVFELIDVIGVPTEDPGSGWEVAGIANATVDHTLVRKASVTEGSVDWNTSRGTNADDSQWIVNSVDDWTSLGSR